MGAGVQASGKATVLHGIAKRTQDAVVLNRDTIINSFIWERRNQERVTLAPYLPENGTIWTRRSEHYSRRVCLQSLHCLLMVGMDLLAQGKHALLEGGYTKEIEWGYVEHVVAPALKARFGDSVNLKVVFATAPKEVIQARIQARREPHDIDALKDGWNEFWARERTAPTNLGNLPSIIVHTDKEIDWENLLAFLEE